MQPGIGGKDKEEFGLVELMNFALKTIPAIAVFVPLALVFTQWRSAIEPYFSADAFMALDSVKSSPLQAITEKVAGVGGAGMDDPGHQIDEMFMLFQSTEFALQVAEHIKKSGKFDEAAELIKMHGPKPQNESELADAILGRVGLNRGTPPAFTMTISLYNKADTVKLLDILVDSYPAVLTERESQELSLAKTFLQEQLTDVEKRLAIIEDQITRQNAVYRQKKGAMGAGVHELTTEDTLEHSLFEAREQLEETRALLHASENRGNVPGADGFQPSNKYASRSSVETLRRKEMMLELRYKATEALLTELRSTPDPRISQEQAVQDLYRRKEAEYQLFADLKKEIMSVDLQRISIRSKIRVLDRPRFDKVRNGETIRPLLIKRGLFAAIFAVLFTFLREIYNPMVRGRSDFKGRGLIYMGSIPRMGRKKRLSIVAMIAYLKGLLGIGKTRKKAGGETPFYYNMVFQNICARILSYRPDNSRVPQVIAVISATSGEGKTTITMNLARAFAKSGRRTLVVDCDLRRRSLTTLMGFGNAVGLTTYLTNPNEKFDAPVVQRMDKNFEVMPAGPVPADAMELITGRVYKEFLEAMRHYYDVVVLDTPPAMPCSEVITLAGAADLSILSAVVGSTKVSNIEEVIDKLQYGVKSPIGFVLNGHDDSGGYAYYSDYAGLTPNLKAS